MVEATPHPNIISNSSLVTLKSHNRGFSHEDFLRALDEIKKRYDEDPSNLDLRLQTGLEWFPRGRIAVNPQKARVTFNRSQTILNKHFSEIPLRYCRMNQILWDEFRHRFPGVGEEERYKWTWRIPLTHLDSPEVNELETVESQEISEPQETTDNSDIGDWSFSNSSDDDFFSQNGFL
jgi:hypothetical protein